MERTRSRPQKHIGRVGSLGFIALSVFMTSPVFAADVERGAGSTRDRQTYEGIKERQVARNLAAEQKEAENAKMAKDIKDIRDAQDSTATSKE